MAEYAKELSTGPVPEGGAGHGRMGRITAASLFGTAIEFYDFYIYGMAAALVFNHVFFPDLSTTSALLASFSTFGVAFVARPFGSMLFGHFGDRFGRKSVLVVSLLMMGLSTAFVGLLPGYSQWGIAAPVVLVLLRFVQGVGLGGEFGGAALLAVEHAPRGHRGKYGSAAQLGAPLGLLVATAVFWVMSCALPGGAFIAWGWRVPFLLSFAFTAVGLVVRLKVAETPVFRAMSQAQVLSRVPVKEVLRRNPRELLLGAGAMVVVFCTFYTGSAFCLSYATGALKIARGDMLAISLIGCLTFAAGIWLSATGSDRIGRKRMMLIGAAVSVPCALAVFPLMDTRQIVLIALALGALNFCTGLTYGPIGAYLPELFGARVRYTGASLAYNLGGVLGAAAAPLIATHLQASFGSFSVGLYMGAAGVVSLACLCFLPETGRRGLGHQAQDPARPVPARESAGAAV
ncbi:MFS transporter [Streptomyces sp. NPDC006487]|uniref:MFS transporter n=1 Tax=Streptomyces sp. NPDC006487 TaxID=3364748 RepID=UPI0036A8D887